MQNQEFKKFSDIVQVLGRARDIFPGRDLTGMVARLAVLNEVEVGVLLRNLEDIYIHIEEWKN